ncbi:hypothetical protein [Maridesulfovibrio bastinii]|uniref:hypothetical protein n=1 Tax=Maridesulfovibrio bastinii TaxID=47157 RepID=UPI0004149D0E|nr:hypothetical protein [Maridesulfovibrio bastinii]
MQGQQVYTQQPMQGQQVSAPINGQYATQTAKETNPKLEENKFGQIYGMMNDLMEGKTDLPSMLNFIQSSDGDFIKGMLVGGALTFLLNNEAVKGAIAGVFGSSFGSLFGENEAEPQVADMIKEQEAGQE